LLYLDLETFSELDLRKCSLDRYASHPSTRILMCAYAVDDSDIQLWQEGDDRSQLDALFTTQTCVAWNKGFEHALTDKVWRIKAKAWADAMVKARYASLPGGLKDCNQTPYFAGQSVTTKETLLINKFCKPGKKGQIHDRHTDPEDWQAFCDYCKRDVQDTRLIDRWIDAHFSIPERVHRAWLLDQEINRRGMPVDVPFVAAAEREAQRLTAIGQEQLKTLTGLENPNSVKQLFTWLSERGYMFNSLGKELLQRALAEHAEEMTPDARAAIQLRLDTSKSSLKKLPKILEQVSDDDRLREQYRYYGAHTGRWAGKGAQLQNLKAARTKEEAAKVAEVVSILEEMSCAA